MTTTLKSLRALADPTRLRITALLEHDELSVNELQEITRMGQSRISTHLGLLQEAGLLQSRREGKRTFYRMNEQAGGIARDFVQLAIRGAKEMAESSADQINLKRILNRRTEQAQLFFNQVAGRFDRSYGPGRSWQAFGQLLLRILPPLVIADLGSGEGLLSELLARRAKKVIAVDNSEKSSRSGRQSEKERAEESGIPSGRSGIAADRSAERRFGRPQPGAPSCGQSRTGHSQRRQAARAGRPNHDLGLAPSFVCQGARTLRRPVAWLPGK